jgi:hypothetical protein
MITCVFLIMASANVVLYFVAFVQWANRTHAPPTSLLLFLLALVPIVGSCLVVFFARIDWQWARVLGFSVPVLVSIPAMIIAGVYVPLLLGWAVYALCIAAVFLVYRHFFPVQSSKR